MSFRRNITSVVKRKYPYEICQESFACHETPSPWSYLQSVEPSGSSSNHSAKRHSRRSDAFFAENFSSDVVEPDVSNSPSIAVVNDENENVLGNVIMDSNDIVEPSIAAGSDEDVEDQNENVLGNVIMDSSVFGQSSYQRKRQGVVTTYNDSGDDDNMCCQCNAFFWSDEALKKKNRGRLVYTTCCAKGKVRLPYSLPTPEFLEQLLNPNNGHESKTFRENIRVYNSMFAFTSMGAKIDHNINNTPGPYVFKISGQVHHRMGSILPFENECPRYAQLYVYDTGNEVLNRIHAIDPNNANKKLDPIIVEKLANMLDEVNELAQKFRSVRDEFENDSLPNLNMNILDRQAIDSKQYEMPSASEIGGLIVGDIGEFDSNRDIIIRSRSGNFKRISKIHPKLMALQYPLLFPYGENGFEINTPLRVIGWKQKKKKTKLTMVKFVCYQVHDRKDDSSTLLKGGRLFQQYLVDAYATVEENRLDYIRNNQPNMRCEQFNQLTTLSSNGVTKCSDVGKTIFLPGSHIGSPRDMLNNYQDAMAICRCYGNPDLFITFTCNVKWPEIVRYFHKKPGYRAEDRPDIISRIFKIKVDDMIAYVKTGEPFGAVDAHVCTIEFQKRGLPHAHILFWLKRPYKCYSSTDIDSIISAELPDKNAQPDLFEMVRQFMIHGPCGQLNPKSPCMRDGSCTKSFPKPFKSGTMFHAIKAPEYRRRDDNSKFVVKNDIHIGNNFVVPYNPILLLRYNAHINVESCSQSMLIKYLFKYINKGPDRARVAVADNVNDEIKNYLNCRYLTPHESVWRLFEFSIHNRFPAVQYLKIHLPGQQSVCFNEGQSLDQVVDNPNHGHTMLTAWFDANTIDKKACKLTYAKFPSKYVWDTKTKAWIRRKFLGSIGRIAHVPPLAGELYYLRMLLNIQKGCRDFTSIRTVHGIMYPNFQEACRALGLLDDDKEWMEAMIESSFTGTSYQIRQLFVTIILFCNVSDPRSLFDAHWKNMSDDVVYKMQKEFSMTNLTLSDNDLKNSVLHELENLLSMSGSSLKNHNLPMPRLRQLQEFNNKLIREELDFDCEVLKYTHSDLIAKLNSCQKMIYDQVIEAVESKNHKSFFVYGCGGTGKTFLWNTIISKLRSEGKIVLAVASSGIASLLLPKGRTAHSRFMIKSNMDKVLACSINKNTNLAYLIEKAELIIWDEAPMCNKCCVESLDKNLRDIMSENSDDPKKNIPFGGKSILFGGDFRQTLPVIQGGTKEQIIESTLNNSYLWPSLTVFHLTENMRLTSADLTITEINEIKDFAEWILQIGEGRLPSHFVTNDPDASWIKIPDDLLADSTISPIESIFTATYPSFNEKYSDTNYLRERAIVTPKNLIADEINRYAIDLLPGDKRTYFSSDSISFNSESYDSNSLLYPVEFLNKLEFSGMPTHELILKIGMPIMLLRNLNQIRGLCNGTRLIVTKMFEKLIEAKILTGTHIGEKVYIPRIVMIANETKWPFTFKRRQFPVRACYAMTINKSQGQSLNQVGIFLTEPVFSHGQLYVALSRVTSKNGLKIIINNGNDIPYNYTKNIVYKDVLRNI